MSSAAWSHSVQIARPLGLLSRTRTQLRSTQSTRISPHQYRYRNGVRSFHFAPTVLSIVQATQDTIVNIHNVTHIPWFLLIPCVAIGINAVARLPFNIYIRRIYQRRAKLTLILRSWSWHFQRDVLKERVPVAQQENEVKKRYKRTERRILRTLGLQKWKSYSTFLGFPFWLIGIECVRRICGGPRGIIGNFITGRAEDAAATAAAASTQEGIEAATSPADITSAAADHISTIDPSTTSAMTEHLKHLQDPSIAFEGCLWFPDLSVADPYHVLPAALSIMMAVNLLPRTRAGLQQLLGLASEDGSMVENSTFEQRLRLRRVMIVLVSLVGPLTADLPAALHLYWLTSSATYFVTDKILSHFMPINIKRVERCKGVEVNIIRPKPSDEGAHQIQQQTIKK